MSDDTAYLKSCIKRLEVATESHITIRPNVMTGSNGLLYLSLGIVKSNDLFVGRVYSGGHSFIRNEYMYLSIPIAVFES